MNSALQLSTGRVNGFSLARVAGPAVVGATFIAMLIWTWFKWPDPLIDFGRELYLAWQVSEGKLLYRDVEHFNGPLSVHVNAALFKLFGPSIQTLVNANIIIAVAIVALLYFLIRRVGGAIAATACGVTFSTLFACVQLVDTGNYNFITPYSHEVTHGLLLALSALWCFMRYLETRKLVLTAATGALLGLLWLTKLEIFLAGAASIVAGILLHRSVADTSIARLSSDPAEPQARPRFPVPSAGRCFLCTLLGFASVVAIAVSLLMIRLPAADAMRGFMGSSWYILDSSLTSLPFYRRVAGLDDTGGNIAVMLVIAAVMTGLIGVARFESMRRVRQHRRARQAVGEVRKVGPASRAILLLATLPPLTAVIAGGAIPWQLALRGLPLVVAGLLIHRLITTRTRRTVTDVVWSMFLVFALLLLAKIALAAQLQHYGFALAMPATLAIVVTLVVTPEQTLASTRLRTTGQRDESLEIPGHQSHFTDRDSSSVSVVGVSIVITFIVVHLLVFNRQFASKPLLIGEGSNAFFAAAGVPGRPSRGESLAALLDRFESIVPNEATLAAVPEGAMINFLTRRANPTPFITLQPPEFLMFGTTRITQAYMGAPPDFIVINLSVDPAEYGSRGFDVDYGKELADSIKRNYTPLSRTGKLILLRRN